MTRRPERKIRCAIYTRKSSEEGLDMEFNSLDAQREAAEAYIASQRQEGWIGLNDRYDDGGFSGGSLERPALRRLLADIEAGRVDCVVVYKIDRLSRALMDFAKLVEVFERHGVTFVSVTQQFNTTSSMGRLTLNILLSFAQFEREVIGERIRDKFAASRRKGMWMGGIPPLGYDVRDRRLVVNPDEAALVRRIFERFVKLGSATELVRELTDNGCRGKSWVTQGGRHRDGRLFDKGALYKLLNNRVHIGDAVHKGTAFPGEHEAIVDRALWDRAHAILAANARNRANQTRADTPALLKGIIRCTSCGTAMTPSHTRKSGRVYRYYVCLGAMKNGHDSCSVRSVSAGDVEEAVLDQIRGLIRAPEIVARTWMAARAEDAKITEREIVQALQMLDPVWDELFPGEQARVVRMLVGRVDLDPDCLDIQLRIEGLHSLVADLRSRDADERKAAA